MPFFDSNTAPSSYSIVGRRVEINGIPFIGLGDITGGGVTKEGQTYARGTDGRILFLSDGIKTPKDLTTIATLGTAKSLRIVLEQAALAVGLVGQDRWMDVPVTFVNQIASNDLVSEPWTETMVLSVQDLGTETAAAGDGSKCTIVWKQHKLPQIK